MALAGSFVDNSAVAPDLNCLAIVKSLGRHEFDATVAVLVFVPIDKRGHALAGLVFGGKWLARVIRSIPHRPEQ
jgi:hypothetical protein